MENKDNQLFCDYIKDRLYKIYDDYTIIHSYIADYDRDGEKREVVCENGWCGWLWDLKSQVKDVKIELYNDIIENLDKKNIEYDKDKVYSMIFS
jgi:hypothetical protein